MRIKLPRLGDSSASEPSPKARTIAVDENGKVKRPSADKLKQVVEQSGKSTRARIRMQQKRIMEESF